MVNSREIKSSSSEASTWRHESFIHNNTNLIKKDGSDRTITKLTFLICCMYSLYEIVIDKMMNHHLTYAVLLRTMVFMVFVCE